MPGNGNGGGGGNLRNAFSTQSWGEGGQTPAPAPRQSSSGEGGTSGPIDLSSLVPPKPDPPYVRPKWGEEGYVARPGEKGWVREAKNVQRANIDRSSYYDPTEATQALGTDYLATRNASNPQPAGSTGAGAVGYEFTPSDERLY